MSNIPFIKCSVTATNGSSANNVFIPIHAIVAISGMGPGYDVFVKPEYNQVLVAHLGKDTTVRFIKCSIQPAQASELGLA